MYTIAYINRGTFMTEDIILDLISSNLIYLLLAILVIVVIFKGVKIVPQSEQHVIERFGRLHKVLGPGINLIVPFLDVVRHKISIPYGLFGKRDIERV